MEQISFIPFLKEMHLKHVYKWFEKDDFYYDTYQPSKIPYSEIDRLVNYSDSHTTMISYNKEFVGLCDYIIEYPSNTAKFEFCLINEELYNSKGKDILYKYIEELFNNFPITKVEKYIYKFDFKGEKLFKNYPFYLEGAYQEYIYKDGQYWDVYVFSLLREEFIRGI